MKKITYLLIVLGVIILFSDLSAVFGKLKLQVLAIINTSTSTTELFHKSSLLSPTISIKDN